MKVTKERQANLKWPFGDVKRKIIGGILRTLLTLIIMN